MIIKVKGIHLYTGLGPEGGDSLEALKWMRENLGRDNFTHLHYGDPDAHQGVFDALNTWFPNDPNAKFEKFPFATWDEFDSDFNIKRNYAIGLDAIKSSNLDQLIKL